MRFVVLCSSRGTVFQATLDAIKKGSLTAECVGLVADSEDRECVLKAKEANLPVKIVPRTKAEDREAYDKKLSTAISELLKTRNQEPAVQALRAFRPEWGTRNIVIACMGWMYLLSPWFLNEWKGRVINVHPSLLPKYPGIQPHDAVLAAKEKESGMTIHVVDEGMDNGRILIQKRCQVLANDTYESLKKRVQALECEWYPRVLQMIERGEVRL